MIGNQPTPKKLKFVKSTDASIGLCPCCKTTVEDRDHVLRRSAQQRVRYLALKDIRGTFFETKSPAGQILWKVSHISCPTSLSPCPLIPFGTQDALSCWSSKLSMNRNALVGQSFPRLLESHVGSPRGSP